MSDLKILKILKGKGNRSVDNFYYTLLAEPEGGNRIGNFVPPSISSSALVLQNEYGVPNNISIEIQSMLQQLNGLPLITKENKQEEEVEPAVEDTSNIDIQQGD